MGILMDGNFSYNIDYLTNQATVLDTNSMDSVITVPEKVSSYFITGIKENAFRDMDGVKEIILPETIKRIGANAFRDNSVKKIIFKHSNKYSNFCSTRPLKIRAAAFKNCFQLERIDFLEKESARETPLF